MAFDLKSRLRILLSAFQGMQWPSTTLLSVVLDASEVEVRNALLEMEMDLQSPAPSVQQIVNGTANSQFGDGNHQVNVQGVLIQLERRTSTVPGLDDLRELMVNPAELYDSLERHLVAERSHKFLTDLLTVTAERPEWEELFENWVRLTPLLQGQPWFVVPIVSHYASLLDGTLAAPRYNLFPLLFEGLLAAAQPQLASQLFKNFLAQLEAVACWKDIHWNLLYVVVKTFWCRTRGTELQIYISDSERIETQFEVSMALRHASNRMVKFRKANSINRFLVALAYLLYDVGTDDVISLLSHCTSYEWLSESLEIETARELLNALDHTRQRDHWWVELTQEQHVLRHSFVDMVARQILSHIAEQLVEKNNDEFVQLLDRAGMIVTPDNQWVSRYIFAQAKK